MDFHYVVEKQEKARICFGSGLERKLLDFDTKGMVSKHATSNLKKISPELGPGTYEVLLKSSVLTRVTPTSNLGTVLGGRKALKKGLEIATDAPGPIYEIPSAFPKDFKQTYAPFNSCEERMKSKIPNVPGVGIYNVAPYKRRRMAFAHSFGGKTCLLPAVKMKCGFFNFDTCERCEKYPEGDYWSLDLVTAGNLPQLKKSDKDFPGIFLCRRCYELENREHKIFNKGQMRSFKKVRDCSKVHFHDGCRAKLFLVSPQEIEKVKERESYMALYFS